MKKGKGMHEEEEGEKGGERWLLTYADMITLLLALFIILYSMSSIEAKKFAKIAESFGPAFNNGPNQGTGTGTGTGSGSGTGTGTGSSTTSNVVDPLDDIYNTLTEYVNQNELQNQISLNNSDSFVQIRLTGTLMFVPDSPQLLESSKPVIQEISGALIKVYDMVDHITISGNTADVGEHTTQTDAFSWYLSVNRADTVRRILVEYGLPEDKLSLEGYGHYNPIASNKTEDGRCKNRRAEINVYKYPAEKKSTGLEKK